MAPPPSLDIGALLAGKYRLVRPLGRGGMAVVWEAVHEAVGKRVAVKLLEPLLAQRPEFVRRFQLEARAASIINHPDIVDVLDSGVLPDGGLYLVMELLAGVTLKTLLADVPRLTLPQALAVLVPILDALDAAHTAGVVHRDLKPANVFLTTAPRPGVKLLDFGISKFVDADELTKTGDTLGTPAFMAPEQVKDSRSADPRSDVYAAGAVLFRMLEGAPPFAGGSHLNVLARVLTEEAPRLTAGDERLRELVARCLAKRPEERPPTAGQVRTQLLALAQPDSAWVFERARALEASLASPPPVTSSTSAKRGWRLGLVAGLVVVGLGAVGVVEWRSRANEAAPSSAAPASVTPPSVELTLTAAPTSAVWDVDGRQCNPCTVTALQGARLPARVSATAHLPLALELTFESTRVIAVTLEPEDVVEPVPVTPVPVMPASNPPKLERHGPARSQQGVLSLHVTPWGTVTLDGREVPSRNAMDFVVPTSAGKHRLVVTNPHFRPHESVVTVVMGKTVERRIELKAPGGGR